eukprot:TRINITY_DN842_c0_g1_i1.p1 TRINITY_DN842_c0_g1~~TRINITY_DN842_c0_g1_i1.p1  ORF type:complete len:215 (-),score=-6.03 TRINITY_DN842_c0_g1_i1:363-1007(-)
MPLSQIRHFPHDSSVLWCSWSPDSTYIASASSNIISVWNVFKGSLLFSFLGHTSGTSIFTCEWSPFGVFIASGGDDGQVIIWNAKTGQEWLRLPQRAQVTSCTWSPCESRIAVTTDDAISVWDPDSGILLASYHQNIGLIVCSVWSPDGCHIASGSTNREVILWKHNTITEHLIFTGHKNQLTCCSWFPDGTKIASTSVDGRSENNQDFFKRSL